jgi:hypothetical protein
MVKVLRVIVALALAGLILHVASLATRDCTVGLFAYENCWWLWVREQCGLPASKFLRAGFLELVGLALLAALILTFRYVFPPWRKSAASPHAPESHSP